MSIYKKKEVISPIHIAKQPDKGNLMKFLNDQRKLLKREQMAFNSNIVDSLFNLFNHLVNLTCLLSFTSKSKHQITELQFTQSKLLFHKQTKAFITNIHLPMLNSKDDLVPSTSMSTKARVSTSSQSSKRLAKASSSKASIKSIKPMINVTKNNLITEIDNDNGKINGSNDNTFLIKEISNKDIIEKIKKKLKTKQLGMFNLFHSESNRLKITKLNNYSKSHLNTLSGSDNNKGLNQRCQSVIFPSRNGTSLNYSVLSKSTRSMVKDRKQLKWSSDVKLSGYTFNLLIKFKNLINKYNEIKTKEEIKLKSSSQEKIMKTIC